MSVLGQALGVQREKKRNFFYPTIDRRAVAPLIDAMKAIGDMGPRNDPVNPHPLGDPVFEPLRFAEPCAGAGDLIMLLEQAGLECAWALELEPQGWLDGGTRNRWPVAQGDALQLTRADLGEAQIFISNLPWHRPWLHPLIRHLAAIAPLWSLHDASWAFTGQAAPFLPLCTDIVAVGRLRWFDPDPRRMREVSESDGDYARRQAREAKGSDPPTDNAWYRFDAHASDPMAPPRFHFRGGADGDARQARLI